MPFITRIINSYFAKRLREVDRFRRHPAEVQQEQLDYLLRQGRRTEFGRDHALETVRSAEAFRNRLPVTDYEGIRPYIDRLRRG